MSVPEVYLAHSKSLAKKIKEGILKPDVEALTERLKKSYEEGLARRIAECAIRMSNDCDSSSQ